jgi:uncharacterized protein (DUF1499 family)
MNSAGLICALAAAALLVAGPYGVRAGWWSYLAGFGLLALSLLLAVAAIVLLLASARRAAPTMTLAGLAIALAVILVPVGFAWAARGAPAIHDISTDLSDPPRFDAVLALRGSGANPVAPPDERRISRQRDAYPDVQPLVLPVPPGEAFSRALRAAHTLGWEVIATDPHRGHLEAVDTTRWFGFKDDVVVRILDAPAGTRIDVRSVSRVGVGDAGTNARRIRAFLREIRQLD